MSSSLSTSSSYLPKTKSAFITSIIYQIQQLYSQKTLTQRNQQQINKLINQMHILSIIYQQCVQQNKQIIDEQLLRFQKVIKQEMKKGSGFIKWMGWAEINVISFDDCWVEICNKVKQGECQRLIDDMGKMKKSIVLA